MSTYVMSDIHGQYNAFKEMLKLINFDILKDKLIINGDIIDRGPDSYKMIQFVINTPNVIMLLGNHELMMCEYFECGWTDWFLNGGLVTLKNLDKNNADIDSILEWARNLPVTYKIKIGDKKYLIGHGNPLQTKTEDIVWDRSFPYAYINRFQKYDGEPTIIIGHTPTHYIDKNCKVANIIHDDQNNALFIDCGAADPEDNRTRLACLRLNDLKEFYVPIKK